MSKLRELWNKLLGIDSPRPVAAPVAVEVKKPRKPRTTKKVETPTKATTTKKPSKNTKKK